MAITTPFQCSPALHRKDGDTCLPKSSLERLVRTWNKYYPRDKIVLHATRKNKKDAKDGNSTIWHKLRDAIKKKYKCSTEYCLVKKIPGIQEKDKNAFLEYFRPEKPKEWNKKPRLWLDSYNIEDVMKQYEKADKTFEFIGPVPIDFDTKLGIFGKCVVDELCNLDLQKIYSQGKHKIAIVFNLDKHDEPGSHWVCAFIDIPKKTAYYFDSYGFEPPAEVVELLKRCKEQGCNDVFYNDIRHQRKGSECGMYCLFVLICLFHNKPFDDICKNIMDDDTIASFRDIIYATENPSKETINDAIETLCIAPKKK